jgi:hypothetical protein
LELEFCWQGLGLGFEAEDVALMQGDVSAFEADVQGGWRKWVWGFWGKDSVVEFCDVFDRCFGLDLEMALILQRLTH